MTTSGPAIDRSRWLALVVLCAGMLMVILDGTIVNVALPAIQDDLGFSQSSLAWVVNAYLIPFGGLLLLAGRLGDLLGRRSVFLAGLALFTGASLLCGLAQSQEVLVGARFLQGIGGALASAVILGMIVTMFTEPRERATAIGVYSFVASAGASIGLLAGGVLTQTISWHWIFFVNLPIGVVTGLLALRLIAPDRGIGIRQGADLLGAVLVTGGLMLGVYTIVGAADHGWVSARTLGLGAIAIALLAAFVVRQARARTPLMPLRILRSRNVSGANLVQVLMVAGLFGMFFLGVLYMQRVLGYDAIETGLAFLPVALLIGALSLFVTPRLTLRFGERPVLLVGLTLAIAGLALFSRVPEQASYAVEHPAVHAAARRRSRTRVPRADEPRDVRRHARRRRPGLGPRQHLAAGGRRARVGGAGHPVHVADGRPARAGRVNGVGAHRRLRAGVRRRGLVGRRRAADRRDGHPRAGAGGGGGRASGGAEPAERRGRVERPQAPATGADGVDVEQGQRALAELDDAAPGEVGHDLREVGLVAADHHGARAGVGHQGVVQAVDVHARRQAAVLARAQPEPLAHDVRRLAAADQGAGQEDVRPDAQRRDPARHRAHPVGALGSELPGRVAVPGPRARVLRDPVPEEQEPQGSS